MMCWKLMKFSPLLPWRFFRFAFGLCNAVAHDKSLLSTSAMAAWKVVKLSGVNFHMTIFDVWVSAIFGEHTTVYRNKLIVLSAKNQDKLIILSDSIIPYGSESVVWCAKHCRFPSANICSIYILSGSLFSIIRKSYQLIFNTARAVKGYPSGNSTLIWSISLVEPLPFHLV